MPWRGSSRSMNSRTRRSCRKALWQGLSSVLPGKQLCKGTGLWLTTAEDGPDLQSAAVDHLDRHIEDDSQTHIGDPMMLLKQAGDEAGRNAHQGNRKSQAKD